MSDEKLRAALGYSRFKEEPRVLILDTKYLVVRDIIDASNELGWKVHLLPTKKSGKGDNQFVAQLLTALVTFRPDFIITVNHLGFDESGVLSELLEKYNIPLASWFVDHPMPILGGAGKNATENTQIFCFERTSFPWLVKHGFEDPVFLPTGSNRRYFHPDKIDPDQVSKFNYGLTFAASSWWMKARLEPLKKVRSAARQISNKTKINKTMVADNMEKLFKKSGRLGFAAAQVALAEASMQTRKRFVNSFDKNQLRVYGDEYWKNLCPGINLHPYLKYETQLPALFAGCKINANITAEQMPTAVNQRVWDVPGSAGVLLTDDQEDALDVFKDGEDMIFYSSFEEALSKSEYYLKHPSECDKIRKNGFDKVEQYHRATHRMQEIYRIMKIKFS